MRGTVLCMLLAALIALTGFVPAVARAQTFPPRPSEGTFIVDQAGLIATYDRDVIEARLQALLNEKRIPVYIVTIPNVGQFAGGATVDSYARMLFDNWGIGSKDYNYGVLLLVSSGDRRARIELGADWGRSYDPFCADIMDNLIVPRFKTGRFSDGITSGAEGLDAMARGQPIPSRGIAESFWSKVEAWSGSKGFWHIAFYGFIAVAAIVSSIYNRITTGKWANDDARNTGGARSRSSSDDSDSGEGGGGGGGGGWGGWGGGGGGFGGGFSGGGGASGSW
ncbi:MAG: TPM domain-containing protein [Phycisphaerales bacterium]